MTKGVHGTGILSVLVLAFAKVLPRLTTARADVHAKESVGEHTRHHDQLDGARLTATIVRCALGHTHLNVVQTLLRSAFAGDLAELYRCLPTYTHRNKRTWKASPYHYGKAPTRC